MWAVSALAAPLVVDVRAEVPPSPPAVASTAGLLYAGIGDARVDGRLDDAVWVAARPQALVPSGASVDVPRVDVRLAVGERGLALALERLQPSDRVHLALDADGRGQRWVQLDLDEDGVRAVVCTVGAPCVDADVVVRGVGAVREVGVPWAVVGAPSTALRGALEVERGGLRGAWASTASGVGPGWRAVALPVPAVQLQAAGSCWSGRWSVSARARRTAASGTWTWSRWLAGERRDEGQVELDTGTTVAWELPWSADAEGVLELRRPSGALVDDAVVVALPGGSCGADLVTPVHATELVLAWWTATPAPDLGLRVLGPDGEEIGSATVSLPAGAGDLRVGVEPAWPSRLRVVFAPWVDTVTVRR